LKLVLVHRYLVFSGIKSYGSKSVDSEGRTHFGVDLLHPTKRPLIDVEIHTELDFEVLSLIKKVSGGNPIQVWTQLEVYCKSRNLPVLVVLKDFLKGKLLLQDIQSPGLRTFKSGKYIYTIFPSVNSSF
jgi:hypothetical protein